MSTEITRHSTNTALTIAEDQTGFTDQQIAALRQIGLGANTQADVEVFFHQAKRSGLDPFRREIYMITRKTKNGPKATIQTGIDGFYKIADRVTRQTGGTWGIPETLWCGPDGQWRDVWLERTPPAAAKVTVERNGSRFTTVATSAEYNAGSPMWQKMPARMIAKCAEALAIRRAFPDDLSGLYTSEEMAQADNQATAPSRQPAAAPQQGGSRLAQAMHSRQPQPAAQPVAVQPEPWVAQWGELKEALASAGLAPEEDRGDLWLAKLTELTGASWTHPNQITPEDAARIHEMLAGPAQEPEPSADAVTGELIDEPAA
ncbi:phage recombination protein Bet [Micrococcus luteus]|nr:phage recombination protein Bet [Micrococcus luteus]